MKISALCYLVCCLVILAIILPLSACTSTVEPASLETETQSPTSQEPTFETDIQIIGSPDFIQQTILALTLLKEKTPDDFEMVERYTGIIEQSDRSGMWAYLNPPKQDVSDNTSFYSVTWYAGTIVHDSTHSKLYHEYIAEHGLPVPDDIWIGRKAEVVCCISQYKVLVAIGAPSYEVDYLWSLVNFNIPFEDVDGDGDYDWDDYINRTW